IPVSASFGSGRATCTEPRLPESGQIAASESASVLACVRRLVVVSRAIVDSLAWEFRSDDEHAQSANIIATRPQVDFRIRYESYARTSRLYAIRCGWSASGPLRFLRSS